ncbi:MAG: hypothetical protein R3204_08860, partial [Oceanospirillum sp.]|nr:hypothetical protein [Oceanospirillum sp.]
SLNSQVTSIREATHSSNALSLQVTEQLDDFLELFQSLESSSRQTSEKVALVADHAGSAVVRISQVIYKQNLYATLEEFITHDGVNVAESIDALKAKADDYGVSCSELLLAVDNYVSSEDADGEQLVGRLQKIEQEA